jgi:ubiquinone/menaquinone biosynthesis C-methylase UbiE
MSHGKHEHGKHEHGKHEHKHVHGDHRDKLGNPEDLAHYIERLESAQRSEWQQPDKVIAALRIAPGSVACEVGGGSGYFALRLARAVGEAGHVFAVDASPVILSLLRDRLERERVHNVTPVLATGDDPLLPAACCDLALTVNTFHHFDDKAGYLRRLARALRPGARVALIDFHDGEIPVGPPPEMRLSKAQAIEHVRAAGFQIERDEQWLPYQFFLVLRRD